MTSNPLQFILKGKERFAALARRRRVIRVGAQTDVVATSIGAVSSPSEHAPPHPWRSSGPAGCHREPRPDEAVKPPRPFRPVPPVRRPAERSGRTGLPATLLAPTDGSADGWSELLDEVTGQGPDGHRLVTLVGPGPTWRDRSWPWCWRRSAWLTGLAHGPRCDHLARRPAEVRPRWVRRPIPRAPRARPGADVRPVRPARRPGTPASGFRLPATGYRLPGMLPRGLTSADTQPTAQKKLGSGEPTEYVSADAWGLGAVRLVYYDDADRVSQVLADLST
jgi:hypothetical protein